MDFHDTTMSIKFNFCPYRPNMGLTLLASITKYTPHQNLWKHLWISVVWRSWQPSMWSINYLPFTYPKGSLPYLQEFAIAPYLQPLKHTDPIFSVTLTGSNLSSITDHPWICRGSPQSLQSNFGMVTTSNKPQELPSKIATYAPFMTIFSRHPKLHKLCSSYKVVK